MNSYENYIHLLNYYKYYLLNSLNYLSSNVPFKYKGNHENFFIFFIRMVFFVY